MKRANAFLLLGVLVLSVGPLAIVRGGGGKEVFEGADSRAEAEIGEIRPGYQPWFVPLWEPPSGEIQSLLFSIQAALGAGLVSYCMGWYRGRAAGRRETRGSAS